MLKAKFVILYLFFILTSVPLALIAQNLDTIISADQITVQTDNILQASGNVKIIRGNVSITAEAMIVNEKKNQIKFKDIKQFSDGKSVNLAAQDATLSEDLSEGIISAAKVLIDDTIRVRAEKIVLKNSSIQRVNNIDRITSCKECEEGLPLWYFTASSANADLENQNITYRNVTLRIYGVPVSYIPYLRLPNPNVDRARGFLIPGLAITSNLGVGLKLPYFIPIGKSKDLLITPYISPKTKTIEYRYRQKMRNGDILINGAFSEDDINESSIRSFYRITGKFELGYGLNLNIKASQVNDDMYLGDYLFGSEEDLNTNIAISKALVDKNKLINGILTYVREQTDDGSRDEFYSINGAYIKHLNQSFLSGNLMLDIEGNSALNIAKGDKITRPPSSAKVNLRYSDERQFGSVVVSDQIFTSVSSFVNSENIEGMKEEFVIQYGASSIFSVPMYQVKNKSVRMFSPKVVLAYNDQKGRTKGDYFIGADKMSFGNIYTGRKYSSLSESELGISVSAGFNYSIDWDDSRALELSFGGLWLADATTFQNKHEGLSPKKINYIADLSYKNGDFISSSGRALFNNEKQILTGSLSGQLSLNNFTLISLYEFINEQADERLEKNLENINFSMSYTGFKNINLSASR